MEPAFADDTYFINSDVLLCGCFNRFITPTSGCAPPLAPQRLGPPFLLQQSHLSLFSMCPALNYANLADAKYNASANPNSDANETPPSMTAQYNASAKPNSDR